MNLSTGHQYTIINQSKHSATFSVEPTKNRIPKVRSQNWKRKFQVMQKLLVLISPHITFQSPTASPGEAKCVSFSHVRISHGKQTPGTVILDQVHSQKHMTGLNRPPFKRRISFPAWLQHKAPTAAHCLMSWSRVTSCIYEESRRALIAQVTKISC